MQEILQVQKVLPVQNKYIGQNQNWKNFENVDLIKPINYNYNNSYIYNYNYKNNYNNNFNYNNNYNYYNYNYNNNFINKYNYMYNNGVAQIPTMPYYNNNIQMNNYPTYAVPMTRPNGGNYSNNGIGITQKYQFTKNSVKIRDRPYKAKKKKMDGCKCVIM